MEIPAALYFSCWSLIAITSLGLGFKALDEDDNKSNISPLFIFFLQRFLPICVFHSSSYALVHRPMSNTSSLHSHFTLSLIGFSLPSYAYIMFDHLPLRLILSYSFLVILILLLFTRNSVDLGLCIDFLVRSTIFSIKIKGDTFFPLFVLVVSFFTAGFAAMSDGQNEQPVSCPETEPAQNRSKIRKIAEYGASILASLFLQLLVGFTSLSQVAAFLCFVVAWLGCIAIVMPRREFGALDLLVCNVLLGSTNRFGLSGFPTWFAFGASVVLFVLHDKVKAVKLVRGHDDVVLW